MSYTLLYMYTVGAVGGVPEPTGRGRHQAVQHTQGVWGPSTALGAYMLQPG